MIHLPIWRTWCLVLCSAAVLGAPAISAAAADGGTTRRKTTAAPHLDMPKLGPIPSAEGVTAPKAEKTEGLKSAASGAQYSIAGVRHVGAKGGTLSEVAISGTPPSTESFRTIVSIKCPQKVGAPIEVVVLDPRGDTVMSASGQFYFKADKKHDEAEYTVDWERTPWPKGGTFSVLVRVAGQPMGTWPLKFKGPT